MSGVDEETERTPASLSAVDRGGAVASMLCTVHCVAATFVPAALGALGMGALLGDEAESAFTLVAILFAAAALAANVLRRRSPVVITLLAFGIVGLLASRAVETMSPHDHDEPTTAHVHDEHAEDEAAHEDHDRHGGEHDEGDDAHVIGALISALAGVLLVSGHMLSSRAARQRASPS